MPKARSQPGCFIAPVDTPVFWGLVGSLGPLWAGLPLPATFDAVVPHLTIDYQEPTIATVDGDMKPARTSDVIGCGPTLFVHHRMSGTAGAAIRDYGQPHSTRPIHVAGPARDLQRVLELLEDRARTGQSPQQKLRCRHVMAEHPDADTPSSRSVMVW